MVFGTALAVIPIAAVALTAAVCGVLTVLLVDAVNQKKQVISFGLFPPRDGGGNSPLSYTFVSFATAHSH